MPQPVPSPAPIDASDSSGAPLPGWPTRACALFLDFDGTLVELADEPDAIVVPADLPALLAELGGLLGGALALVSGRAIAAIDHHLHPVTLSVAGVHGAERRAADGYVRRTPVGSLDAAASMVRALCARYPALRAERKPGAIALHYRLAPELESVCLETMEAAAQRSPGMSLMRGKRVVELKPSRASKGAAVRAFMDTPAFRSRRPWFVGDDVTDESAFEYVQSVGGVAVRVGAGETLAAHRLPNPAAVRRWLAATAAHLVGPDHTRVSR